MHTQQPATATVKRSPVLLAAIALLGIELLWWLYNVAVATTFQPDVSKLLALVPAALAVTTAIAGYLIVAKGRDVGYWIGFGLQIVFIVQGIAIGYRISGSILGAVGVIVAIAAVVCLYLARAEKARV